MLNSSILFVLWVFFFLDLFPLWIFSVMTVCRLFLSSSVLVCSQGIPADVGAWDAVRSEGRWV